MQTPQILEVTIDSIAQGGDGVGRVDGLVVFAAGALPGEVVRVQLSEQRQSYARGSVIEVLTPSPDRVAATIEQDGHAAWQHVAYEAQLRYKETILREQLAKLAGLENISIAPIIAAPHPLGYRTSARLHVENGRIGYHQAGTREVVDLANDPLLMPALNDALAGLREVLLNPDLLEGITLRASAAYNYVVAGLHAAPGAAPVDLADLAAAWRANVPTLAGVVVFAEGYVQEPLRIHDELAGVVFSLSPESFFQVNPHQAERMIGIVGEQLNLQPGANLLDLYSGAGAFALPLSKGLNKVVAVEEHPSAVADGQRSADMNFIINVEFIRSATERALSRFTPEFDAAVLDPPRRGCHPAVLTELVALAPAQIAYISCHPGILARDLGPLLTAGYSLDLVQPVDLFPQTPHIETVVILRRP